MLSGHGRGDENWLWLMNEEVSDDPVSIPEEVGQWRLYAFYERQRKIRN